MQNNTLQRGLKQRHISLMALGASIGVGLFLGSASALKLAGPGILLAYAVGGFFIFLIMRALGEMAVSDPVAGSFSHYAHRYIGPLSGFLTGWNYWFFWIIACMLEIAAASVYMGLWFPDVSPWIWSLATLAIMGTVNFLTVRAYGEFEFWLALIKIVTIVMMIIGCLGMILFGFGNEGVAVGISNLWSHGGFLPFGIAGVVKCLPLVVLSYLGVEMIGLTAGEAVNPEKTLARAIDSVFWRIMVFYVGALFVILAIYPWNEIGTHGSPFVSAFEHMGISTAAGIINFVVLTATLSICNSGIFSSGRMLYNLAQQRQAHPALARLSRNGTPIVALTLSIGIMLIGVVLNYWIPEQVFMLFASIATFSGIWAWLVILLAHYKFRRSLTPAQIAAHPYKMPWWPYSIYLTFAFLVLVLGLMIYLPGTRPAMVIGPVWLIFLTAVYYLGGYHRRVQQTDTQLASSHS